MAKLTSRERYVMENLSRLARDYMRSKPTLQLLARLQAKGMITFDPMAEEAALTEDGRRELR